MLSKNEVKYIQSLGQKKGRDESSHFLMEGVKQVTELLHYCPELLVRLYGTGTFLSSLQQQRNAELFQEVSSSELERISQLQTPNHVVAVVQQFPKVVPEGKEGEWMLALDGIRDPGNMGTILRLADWFGIRTVIGSSDCVDVYNPKVVQSSMGSILRVRVYETDLVTFLASAGAPVTGATLGGQPLHTFSFSSSGILVIGNEGNGIRSEVVPFLQHQVSIPSFGQAESLNAAVATGILLWELRRG